MLDVIVQDVELSLALRDAYGNAIVDLESGALRAVATGAHGAVHFQAYEVGAPPRPCNYML